MFSKLIGRFLIKAADSGAAEKGRAGEVDLFPESAQGGGRVQRRGWEFGRHDVG